MIGRSAANDGARMMRSRRSHASTYVVLAATTIVAGLTVHRYRQVLGGAPRDIAGDALWAMMMAWLVSAVWPHRERHLRLSAAFAICVAVELSQLLHAPWLDRIRASTLGHLVLGADFDARDLLAYGVGIVIAGLLDRLLRPSRREPDRAPAP